jgi:hypothetical protein
MAWGISNELLDEPIYLPVVVRGWQELMRRADNDENRYAFKRAKVIRNVFCRCA